MATVSALTTIADTMQQRERLFVDIDFAHTQSMVIAVHLDPDDLFCNQLLWELDILFSDMATTYRFLDDLNDAMWLSYVYEKWEDFDQHEGILEGEKRTAQAWTVQLQSISDRGEARCWSAK